jgi:hypothetical protein
MNNLLEICDIINRSVETEQYEDAQETIGFHLVGWSRIPDGFAWTIYRAERAFGEGPHSRRKLPKYIGTWLSELACPTSHPAYRGVSWGDIMELWEMPGWVEQFNWARLAVAFRSELEDHKADPWTRHRLPPTIWKVVETAWTLIDIDSGVDYKALCEHFDVHDYSSNAAEAAPATTSQAATQKRRRNRGGRRRGGRKSKAAPSSAEF